MLRVRWVVLAGLVSCGVRTPAAIDVDLLLRARGPVEARQELEIRATSDPRDVAARLALAALDEQLQRPSEAIAVLEAVVALGGPFGVRWHDADRARLGRLFAARGRARLARAAATATADLERARGLGTPVTEDELRRARAAGAAALLRHSDAETREAGRRTLATLASTAPGDAGSASASWLGARAGAAPAQRGRFGAWLWTQGARRAAWDELAAWHDQTRAPRDPDLQDAYLVAARWWTPLDRPGPPTDELRGAGRCAFGSCLPREVAGNDVLERAYLTAPPAPPVRDPIDVAALVVITLHQALRGEVSWGPALAARIELAAFAEPGPLAALPSFAQPVIASLVGRAVAAPGNGETPDQRLVLAATRVLAGVTAGALATRIADAPDAEALRRVAALGAAPDAEALRRVAPVGDASYAEALRRVAAPGAAFIGDAFIGDAFIGDARAEAAARHAVATIATADPLRAELLRAIAGADRRDPLIADRLARDVVAGAEDAALMHATIGALFDGLGDPARARAAWQAAVDASAEPAFVRGLAEAQARQGDGDAALVTATAAAAASGDPAVVWVAVARALSGAGRDVHALEAAHSAIELAGPEALAGALEVAIASSRALGRDAQAARLAAQRAQLCTATAALLAGDPTDAQAALDAHHAQASDVTLVRLWIAARWNPRDVAVRLTLRTALTADDPRRAVITAELVELAEDRDPDVRRAAVAALR